MARTKEHEQRIARWADALDLAEKGWDSAVENLEEGMAQCGVDFDGLSIKLSKGGLGYTCTVKGSSVAGPVVLFFDGLTIPSTLKGACEAACGPTSRWLPDKFRI
jgi:hypothetical protein